MKRTASALILSMLTATAWAGESDIDMKRLTNQKLFGDLVEDLGTAMSYKAVTPVEPMGLGGLGIGLEYSEAKIRKEGWQQISEEEANRAEYMGKIRLHKDLPAGFDVGAYYTEIMDSNVRGIGGEVRYAIIDGNTIMPALAVRGSYSTLLSSVEDLDLSTAGLEVSISKGFSVFTPYGGVGTMWYEGTSPEWEAEKYRLAKYFLGVNLNFGPINFAAEADRTGDSSSASAKFGLRF